MHSWFIQGLAPIRFRLHSFELKYFGLEPPSLSRKDDISLSRQ